MHANSFVYYIDHRQVVVFVTDSIKPRQDGIIAILDRQVGKPVRVLCSPNESVELESKVVLFGIVERPVTTPVETAASSFYRSPLRLVLTSNLVPKLIVRCDTATSLYLPSGGDIPQELVRIG